MLRCPFSLSKRQGDGPGGEIRFQIEIPDTFMHLAHKIEEHKGEFFVALGPLEDEEAVTKALKAGDNGAVQEMPSSD